MGRAMRLPGVRSTPEVSVNIKGALAQYLAPDCHWRGQSHVLCRSYKFPQDLIYAMLKGMMDRSYEVVWPRP
jgi:hypothetical protein